MELVSLSFYNTAFRSKWEMSENRLQPPVTQCGSYVKVRYKSSATKGKKKKIAGRKKKKKRYKAIIIESS